jgi:Ca2+-binding EF-hand superfamily protein
MATMLDKGIEFRQRKWTLAFYRFDQTKDGLVRAGDFEKLGGRVAQELGVAKGSAQYDKLMGGYRSIWEFYFKPSDTDGDDAVTLTEHTANIHIKFPPDMQQAAVDANATIFKSLDLDDDGKIEQREFVAFVKALGASEEEAQSGFEHLDQNGNGTLSPHELAAAWIDYYDAEDPEVPGNYFYGRR